MIDKDKLSFNFFMDNIEEKLKNTEGDFAVKLTHQQWQHIINAYHMLVEQEDRLQQIRMLANKPRFFESNMMDYDKMIALENKEQK